MPFEPLKTDEKLDYAPKAGPDMDSQMLAGCSGFLLASVIHYLLGVWPHFVFFTTHLLATLAICAAAGLLPAAIFSGVVARRFGIPAAAGALGGSFAVAIFLYLRLQQVDSTRGLRDMPQPEFPASWVWLVPGAWIVLVLAILLISLRAEHFKP